MHHDNQRIFLRRIVVFGQHQPALHLKLVAFPFQRNRFAPGRRHAVVDVRELVESRAHESAGWATVRSLNKNLWCVIEAACDKSKPLVVSGC